LELGWWRSLGLAILILFALQAATGLWLALRYVPLPDQAYDSILRIEEAAPSRLVRGLHYWGAGALIALLALHLLALAAQAIRRHWGRALWLTGVLLLLATVGLTFTGRLLPWDQGGYWAAIIGTGVAQGIPLLGEAVVSMLRGGAEVGGQTLARFYVLHILILPLLLSAIIGVHLFLLLRGGRRGLALWSIPAGLAVASLILLALLALAVLVGAPLEEMASPTKVEYLSPSRPWLAALMASLGVLVLLLFPLRDWTPTLRQAGVGLLLLLVVGGLFLAVEGHRAALPTKPTSPPTAVSFQREVMPILKRSCVQDCHGSLGGLSLTSYQDIMTTGHHAPTVVPGNPEASLLYQRLLGHGPLMPPGQPLPKEQIEVIRRWIEAGAPSN